MPQSYARRVIVNPIGLLDLSEKIDRVCSRDFYLVAIRSTENKYPNPYISNYLRAIKFVLNKMLLLLYFSLSSKLLSIFQVRKL